MKSLTRFLPRVIHAYRVGVAIACIAARKAPFAFLSGFVNATIVLGLSLVGLAASFSTPLYKQYPIENTLRPALKRPLVLIDADGEPFAKRGECVAEAVGLDELPKQLVNAVLAMEDRRFYSHLGIDPLGILRAARRNYHAGAVVEGGSTITQQLVKNSFLTNVRTVERKAEEALLAMWLEIRLSKEEILERYLSSAYFGESCFGVRAAARHFFDKPVRELTLSESAFLVALLRAPTQLTRNIEDAQKRARLVMQTMVRDGKLDGAQLSDIQLAELHLGRMQEFGGYYADWLTEKLQDQIPEPRSRQPLMIHTTFEPALQRLADEAVRTVLEKRGAKLNASQAGLVAMRTDGRIVAMVGGVDRSASQFNRAVKAQRQPGSAFKTFIYLTALQAGLSQEMMIKDEPVSIDGWEPENFGGRYRGTVPLTQAFASSINTVAVRLSEAVGRENVIATAHDLGIDSPLASNPSLALGTSEVSLLELTSAYAAIAAGAYPIKPWGAASLGSLSADGGRPPRGAGLWRVEHASEMRQLLAAVVRHGSGHAASLPVASFGKTGTSQEHRDAWFIGFAGNMVVGVWVGNDDDAPMKGVTGGSLPAQIWHSFMTHVLKSDPKFKRKLPQIAAFEARDRASPERASRLAAMEALAATADFGASETASYGHLMARGQFDREESLYYEPRAGRGAVSRSFQNQLQGMGWPGQ